MIVICQALGLLFTFCVLVPHGPVTYDVQPAPAAWSSR